jgi:Fe-S cluster biogenesis protein NfuA/rhodanese-related sulfurtransferase
MRTQDPSTQDGGVTLSRDPSPEQAANQAIAEAAKAAAAQQASAGSHELKSDAFLQKRRAGQTVYVFDLRSSADYDAGHLPGAYSLPFEHVEANLHRLPFSGDLMFYDGGEGTAQQVAALLDDNGFSDHWYAAEGLEALKEAIRTSPAEINYEALSPEERAAKVEAILDGQVREFLARDGGGMDVVGIEEDKVMVAYHGACGSCSSSTAGTLRFIQSVLTISLNHEIEVVPVET